MIAKIIEIVTALLAKFEYVKELIAKLLGK